MNDVIEQSIPERFQKIVGLYPNRLAIKVRERSLSYDQLNRHSNQIARLILEERGFGSEPIALLLDDRIDVAAAILGVLKAGKFFVLLDPKFPVAQIAAILSDVQTDLVMTDPQTHGLAAKLGHKGARLSECDSIDCGDLSDPQLQLAPDTLAYITYTSGSTGQPKGVVQNHRNIIHDVLVRAKVYRISQHDRLSLLAFGTSNAIKNICYSLLNGSTLLPFDVRNDGTASLATWLSTERISVCRISASLFRTLCDNMTGRQQLSELRVLLLASDAIYRSDIELFNKHFHPDCLLATGLSSSETGVLADYFLARETDSANHEIPVGYPIESKEVLLLNDDGKDVGCNAVGEIVVRSRYLSPGYWRRPELTAQKFKTDPEDPKRRIYYTGDLGLYRSDGCLIHKGRKDFQVKIRGYRVNLSEVETALLEHPGLKGAGVAAWDREPGEKHLAGYIVPQKDSALNVSELNAFLRNKLPDYMVPSTFIFLDSLPLTNGKLDRSALPKPNHNRPDLKTPCVAPRNDVERKLSQIWAEVLTLDQVGVDDNFFDLGGSSLAGAAIIARVKEVFGMQLPISDLLAAPTVAQLSESIGHQQKDKTTMQRLPKTGAVEFAPTIHVQPTTPFTGFSRDEVEQSIPERFEKIVRLYPDRIAVKAGNQGVTYSELNAMANRVGHLIITQRGTEPEPVGLLVEKGVWQIAAMLGILKAGKFFVLLDPTWPNARIATVLEDAGAELIVADRHNSSADRALAYAGCRLMEFESIDSGLPCSDPSLEISPTALASLVYTSGSTGEPKGVVQSHQCLMHRIMLYTNATSVYVDDRVAFLTAGTSNAVTNTFLALLNGAELLTFNVKKEGVSRLAAWLVGEEITHLRISSPLFRNLCDVVTEKEKLSSLRLLQLTSDTVYKTDIDLYKRRFPSSCVLFVWLSSSETGPQRCYFANHETVIAGTEVPVGYAVENKEISLVDDNGIPLGFNEVGEIVVRSKYLSPGYWNRPELTETKFKPDPRDSEKRLYYSGDLGLMLPDGCLIHKGRKDFRIKIRGYGVDLTEIEKVLRGHAAVRDAVVVGRANESGEVRLIAYFTSSLQPAPTTSELRKFLNKTLPDYMIPASFMFLQALPLTSNGKVDRKALPEPNDQRPELSTPYVLPRNQVERMLAGLWEDVLGVRPVGINDDFFDLGGDSLKLANMISRVEAELGIAIAAREVLEAPRISSLGRLIDTKAVVAYQAANGQRALPYLVNLRVGSGGKRIFCFPYRGGFHDEYFNFCRISRHFNDEYSFYGLRARGVKGDDGPRGTIKEIAADYMKAILSVQPHGPYILVGECGGGIPAFETARQLQAAGEKVELLILFDTQAWSLKGYVWRRLKEPLNYRKRLGLMPASWEYFEKRSQLHAKELKRRKGFEQIRYLLDKFIKLPTAVAHSIQQGKPSATGPATEGPGEISRPAVSAIRLSEKDYFIAAHRYRYRAYTGRIALLVNQEWHKAEPSLGWQKFARGGLDIYPIPGDHDHCVPDNIARVAQILKECLVKAEAT